MQVKFEAFTIYSSNGKRHVINATSFQGACDALGLKEYTFGFKGNNDDYVWDNENCNWKLKEKNDTN
jgi:hypothetical protein